MLSKIKLFRNLSKSILLILIYILIACKFEPVYKNENIISELCSIEIRNINNSAPLYEIKFKNELEYILCSKKFADTKYRLNFEIERSYRELIKSESNFTTRHEETLLVKFNLVNTISEEVIYADSITSKGAYNILEGEVVSTIASKESINSNISLNAARFVLDKIYLFMSIK